MAPRSSTSRPSSRNASARGVSDPAMTTDNTTATAISSVDAPAIVSRPTGRVCAPRSAGTAAHDRREHPALVGNRGDAVPCRRGGHVPLLASSTRKCVKASAPHPAGRYTAQNRPGWTPARSPPPPPIAARRRRTAHLRPTIPVTQDDSAEDDPGWVRRGGAVGGRRGREPGVAERAGDAVRPLAVRAGHCPGSQGHLWCRRRRTTRSSLAGGSATTPARLVRAGTWRLRDFAP